MGQDKKRVERAVRYRVVDDYSATVYRVSESGSETIQANLLDMSRGGLKLSVSNELAVHEVVQVHVANDKLGLILTESAQVRWIREDTETGSWLVGCQIQGEIHEDVLEDLTARGLLNRRYVTRHRVTDEAMAQWELSEEIVPVQLLNLSTRGFCLASDQPTSVGSRLKLTLVDDDGQAPYEILARSIWQNKFESGYLIGCELTMEDVFDLVGHFADTTQSSSNHKERRRRVTLLTGATILAIVAAIYASQLLL